MSIALPNRLYIRFDVALVFSFLFHVVPTDGGKCAKSVHHYHNFAKSFALNFAML